MSAVGSYDEISDAYYEGGTTFIEFLDYIPIVSIISGIARVIFGAIESLFGLIAFPVQLFLRIIDIKKPFILVDGIANIIRGVIAIKPLIGNLILFLYDSSTTFKKDIRLSAGLIVPVKSQTKKQ